MPDQLIPAHSTVPRWPQRPPEVDASGRTFGVVYFGDAGRQVASDWLLEVDRIGATSWVVHGVDLQPVHDAMSSRLASAVVGLRLMIAGPECEVLAAAAVGRSAGLVPAEIVTHATSDSSRRIYCVHCKETSVVEAAVGDVVACGGCRRELAVFAHFSRESGSYLGFLAGAEELPWS
jgi:hypothetical protein